MSANRPATPHTSADLIGATDLAKVDAHEITAEEYEEIPELTDAMLDRATPGNGRDIARRSRGRPRVDSPKEQVTMRLDADVLAAMRASGPGWQSRANDVLRERFKA